MGSNGPTSCSRFRKTVAVSLAGRGAWTTASITAAGTARRGGCTRSPTPAGGCTPGKTTTPDSPPSTPGIGTWSTSRPRRTPSRARRSSAAPIANATASCTGARPGTSARRGSGSRLPRTPTRITCGRSCRSGPTRGRRSCGCAGHTRTITASGRQKSSRASCHDPPILAHRTPDPAGPRRLGGVPRAPRLSVGPPPDRVGRERVHRQRAARRDDRWWRPGIRLDGQPNVWGESAFIGNGRLGAMIDVRDSAFGWTINRTDVVHDQSRFPIGRVVLKTAGTLTGGTARLALWDAEASGTVTTDRGDIRWRSFTATDPSVIVIVLEGRVGERAVALDWVPAEARPR